MARKSCGEQQVVVFEASKSRFVKANGEKSFKNVTHIWRSALKGRANDGDWLPRRFGAKRGALDRIGPTADRKPDESGMHRPRRAIDFKIFIG